MSDDNTQDTNEPSLASAGSHADAWAVEHGGDIVYVAIRADDAQEWAGGGPVDVVPLYRSTTLTDEEREAVAAAIKSLLDDPYDGAPISPHAATLRNLLERMK
jgi:mono/diheme cytochrome c family protein